jgi:hypothetical protein
MKKTCVEKINNCFEDCIYLLLLKAHLRMLFRYLDGKETQHAESKSGKKVLRFKGILKLVLTYIFFNS